MPLTFVTITAEFKWVAETIAFYTDVHEIYLLGQRNCDGQTTSIFNQEPTTGCKGVHYWLLVLVEKQKEHSLNSIQDKLETRLRDHRPCTVIVVSKAGFIQWLKEGQIFAGHVIEKAPCLFNRITTDWIGQKFLSRENEMENLFSRALSKTESFMAGAELYKTRKEHHLAAFMLHQVAEHALHAMLEMHTGLRIHTHNIDKLLRYCSMFCGPLSELFPGVTDSDKKLHSLLKGAYLDSRYQDDFCIAGEELAALFEKVNGIMEMFIGNFFYKFSK